MDCQYWLAQMNSAVSAAEARRWHLVAPTTMAGTTRTTDPAGLDITTMSNLAKRSAITFGC